MSVRTISYSHYFHHINLLKTLLSDCNAMNQRKPLTKKHTEDNENWRQHCGFPLRTFKCIFGLAQTKQSVFFSDAVLGRRKEGFNTAEAEEEYWEETRRFTFNPT